MPVCAASSPTPTYPPTHPPTTTPQIAKLLIIPFVCFVESSFLGRTFSREVVSSIVLVICGVAVVTGGWLHVCPLRPSGRATRLSVVGWLQAINVQAA